MTQQPAASQSLGTDRKILQEDHTRTTSLYQKPFMSSRENYLDLLHKSYSFASWCIIKFIYLLAINKEVIFFSKVSL